MSQSLVERPQKRLRRAITLEQKKALRAWASSFDKKPAQLECIQWWQDQYGDSLGQSAISNILSNRYNYLDNPDTETTGKRKRVSYWTELEAALFELEQRYEGKGLIVTGDILRLKASEFWNHLPIYHNQPCPQWSNGWLSGFKQRHQLKSLRQHGEAASAKTGRQTQAIMQHVRQECSKFDPANIYNMDETGLFWKMIPDRSLSTKKHSPFSSFRDNVL